jgi:flagellar basal body rod protein FlgF
MPLSIVSINGVALTGAAQSIPVTDGSVEIAADGTITFEPAANFNGTITPFDYVITDGTDTATASVSGTVTPVNDAPVATDDTFTVDEDGTVTLDLLSNDTDLEGDALSIVSINGVALTGAAQSIPVTDGSVEIAADGTITFEPAANFNGTITPFDYVITDGTDTATASVSGTVTPVNDAPRSTTHRWPPTTPSPWTKTAP